MDTQRPEIIAIIPARGGSKRLPGKNIMDLGGLPLIVHSIRYALTQPEISQVIVTTDDPEIAQVSTRHGARVIIRPEHLSGDHEPTVSALVHVLEEIQAEPQALVLLQPTNPLRPEGLFRDALEICRNQGKYRLFTVSRSHHKLGRIQEDRFLPFNYVPGQRSQDLEPLYYENGLLYISDAASLRNGQIMDTDSFPMIVDHPFAAVDIDTNQDLLQAKFLLETFRE